MHDHSSYNQSGTQNAVRKVLPMSSDSFVTHVPGRTDKTSNLEPFRDVECVRASYAFTIA
jgi:hypothetical protein